MQKLPESINSASITITLFIFSGLFGCVIPSTANGLSIFSKNEQPFGSPYDIWITKYWNWDYSIPLDSETNTFDGLKENGCLIHMENSVAMLLDTAVGGSWNQKCSLPSGTAFLIPLWTGECDRSSKGYEIASFNELSKCARDFDLGKIHAKVKVDNMPLAELSAVDYSSNLLNNVTEIFTKGFNVTIPSDSHLQFEKPGIFPAAAHGWFVFLKPLPVGIHTIYYDNNVGPTTLSGAGNINTAQITYSMNIK